MKRKVGEGLRTEKKNVTREKVECNRTFRKTHSLLNQDWSPV